MINCFLTATSWGKDYDRRSMSGVPGLVMPCSECGESGSWKKVRGRIVFHPNKGKVESIAQRTKQEILIKNKSGAPG